MATNSYTQNTTFTIANAKELASRFVADLQQCRLAYGAPNEEMINNLAVEIAYLMRDGYLKQIEVGFFTSEWERILAWKYVVVNNELTTNDFPGGIPSGYNISAGKFQSLVQHTAAFEALDAAAQVDYYAPLASKRGSTGVTTKDGNGYWIDDKQYTSGSKGMKRTTFLPRVK